MLHPHSVEPSREPHAFRLPAGEAVMVRPLRPQDAGRLQAYVRDLSDESRRNRFLGAMSELAPTELDRLSRTRRPGELALMALLGETDQAAMIGEAIQVTEADHGRCEIALSVSEHWRRRGLGTLLLQNLECRARVLGVRYLVGDVLRTNTAMKGLARKSGYSVRSPFTDARLIEIVKDLSVPQSGAPCHELFAPVAA